MRTVSPRSAEVFGSLPASLVRELATEAVADVLGALVAAGWRTGQLRHRVGAEPARGSVAQDAEHLLGLLRSLLEQECPDSQHERVVEQRRAEREWAAALAPQPADARVRGQLVRELRRGLRGVSHPPTARSPRVRPACTACQAESSFFVRRDVHLCSWCVDLLAAGVQLGASG